MSKSALIPKLIKAANTVPAMVANPPVITAWISDLKIWPKPSKIFTTSHKTFHKNSLDWKLYNLVIFVLFEYYQNCLILQHYGCRLFVAHFLIYSTFWGYKLKKEHFHDNKKQLLIKTFHSQNRKNETF